MQRGKKFVEQIPKIGIERILLSNTNITSFYDIDLTEKFDDSFINEEYKNNHSDFNNMNMYKYKSEFIPCVYDEKIYDERINYFNYQSLIYALSYDESSFDENIDKTKGKWVENFDETKTKEEYISNNNGNNVSKMSRQKKIRSELYKNQIIDANFESRFESGNLRMALQISELEYDLIVKNDINSGKSSNWFFFSFEIKNKKKIKFSENPLEIKFNIINCMKNDTLFSKGLKVLYFSKNNQKWQRSTKNNYYFHNTIEINEKKLYTLTFTLELNYDFENETIFFSYCYPYTFTRLQKFLGGIINNNSILKRNVIRHEIIGKSLAGNNLDMLVITKFGSRFEEIAYRPCIVLTSRVHPGESNASWVIQGVIEFLLEENNPQSEILRKNFVFKIIPMLNPDGVINGNFRTSLIGKDLNRLWDEPREDYCPTIFYTKEQIKKTLVSRDIFIYCDFHGHSNKPNFFLYGCPSNKKVKIYSSLNFQEMILSKIYTGRNDIFDNKSCIYKVAPKKMKTARAVVKNEFGIDLSYCLESSIGYISLGERKNHFFSPKIYEKIGRDFCYSIFELQDKTVYNEMLVKIQNEEVNKTPTAVNNIKNLTGNNINSMERNNLKSNFNSNYDKTLSYKNQEKSNKEKINDEKNFNDYEKEKKREKEWEREKDKDKDKDTELINNNLIKSKSKSEHKNSIYLKNINIANSNLDPSITDSLNQSNKPKMRLNPIKNKNNNVQENIPTNIPSNIKIPKFNDSNNNVINININNIYNIENFNLNSQILNPISIVNKSNTNLASKDQGNLSSSNFKMFYKMSNGNNNNNSSINNNEEITQRIKNITVKNNEKKESQFRRTTNSISSKKTIGFISNESLVKNTLFSSINNSNKAENLGDKFILRNKSINDLSKKMINVYNNFGMLPNFKNTK